MNRIKLILLTILSLACLAPSAALAVDTKGAITCGVNSAAGINDCTAKPTTSIDSTIKTVINLLTAVIGVVAVIMLIVGGFRYITSGGSPEGTKSARNTIIYAIIGLVVVATAQLIARFVLHSTVK